MFPRGGGIWDQDPILMRDFRVIRRFEIEWKNAQYSSQEVPSGSEPAEQGGTSDLEELLNEYIGEMGEDSHF